VQRIAQELSELGIQARCHDLALEYRTAAVEALEEAQLDPPTHRVVSAMVQFCIRAALPTDGTVRPGVTEHPAEPVVETLSA
jgi:hypothetical protein